MGQSICSYALSVKSSLSLSRVYIKKQTKKKTVWALTQSKQIQMPAQPLSVPPWPNYLISSELWCIHLTDEE